jgi:hypothetical protein
VTPLLLLLPQLVLHSSIVLLQGRIVLLQAMDMPVRSS